jgi:hypothetical protein
MFVAVAAGLRCARGGASDGSVNFGDRLLIAEGCEHALPQHRRVLLPRGAGVAVNPDDTPASDERRSEGRLQGETLARRPERASAARGENDRIQAEGALCGRITRGCRTNPASRDFVVGSSTRTGASVPVTTE